MTKILKKTIGIDIYPYLSALGQYSYLTNQANYI